MGSKQTAKLIALLMLAASQSRVVVELMCATEATAATSPYKTARTKFLNGDIQGAGKTLQPFLFPQPRLAGRELEEARKLFGVCRFLQGNRRDAETVFLQVLTLNDRASLQPEDLLDPSVGTLFEQVRARARSVAKSGKPPRVPPTAAPMVSKSARSETGIFISTNVGRATVFSGGIFIGTAGQAIGLEPGKHQVTVSSEGFEDANKTLVVQPGQLLRLTVQLKKPTPIAPPPQTAHQAHPRRAEAPEDDFGTKKQKSQMDYSADLPGPKPGTSLADEYFRDSQKGTQAPAAVRAPQPRTAPTSPTYQLAPSRAAPTYQARPQQAPLPPPQAVVRQPVYQQPTYQQPVPPQPTYQQPMQPVQPTYQQLVPQQPTYQQPVQPTYQQPVPPQPTYQQPTYQQPTYQQPVQPTYQQPAQPLYPQQVRAISPQQNSRQSRAKAPTVRRKAKPNGSLWIALLPFGAGQFQNQEYMKGGLFGLAQGGGIGWALYSSKKEQDFIALENAALADNDPAKKETLDNDYDADESKAFKNSQKLNQYVGWGIFGVSWAISVVDAIANINTPPKRSSGLAETSPSGHEPLPTEFRWSAFAYKSAGVGLHIDLKF